MEEFPSLDSAGRRLAQPDVTPEELAQIAAQFPALRALVANHPRAYPQLREWIAAQEVPVSPPVPPSAPAGQVPASGSGTVPATRRGAPVWVAWVVAGLAIVLAAGSWVWPHLNRSSAPAAFPAAERAFATPKDAVTFVAQRVAAQDLAGAATAFASTSMVNGYDFTAYETRLGAFLPTTWLPSTSPANRSLNMGYRSMDIAMALRSLVLTVLDPSKDPSLSQPLTDASAVAALTASLDMAPLAHLSVLRVDQVGTGRPQVVDGYSKLAAGYRADEIADFGVLYGTAQGLMSGGATLLRYGDGWHVMSLYSNLLSISNGIVTPTTEQQYEAMVTAANSDTPSEPSAPAAAVTEPAPPAQSSPPAESSASTAAVNVPSDPSTWVLSFDGFGPVHLGMTADQAVATGGFTRMPACDVGALKWTGRSLGQFDVIAWLNDAGQVWRFSLGESPTPNVWGLDFGMTLDQVRGLFGDRLIHDAGMPDGEGSYVVDGPNTYLMFALVNGAVDANNGIDLMAGNVAATTMPNTSTCKAAWRQ